MASLRNNTLMGVNLIYSTGILKVYVNLNIHQLLKCSYLYLNKLYLWSYLRPWQLYAPSVQTGRCLPSVGA